MKVFMLGWEFPPIVSGGLGVACYGLAKALNARGTDVLFVLPKPLAAANGHRPAPPASAIHPRIQQSRHLPVATDDDLNAALDLVTQREATLDAAAVQVQHDLPQDVQEHFAALEQQSMDAAAPEAAVPEHDSDTSVPNPLEHVTFVALDSLLQPYLTAPQYQERAAQTSAESWAQRAIASGPDAPAHQPPNRPAAFEHRAANAPSPDPVIHTPPPPPRSPYAPHRPGRYLAESQPQSVVGPADTPYAGDLFSETDRYAHLALAVAKSEKFDLVHAHDWMTFQAATAVAAATHKPLVLQIHSTELDRAGQSANARIMELERSGMLAADRIIAVSYKTKTQLIEKYGIDPRKIEVVYNATETPGAPESPPKPGAKKRHPHKTVLFLGRLTRQKGPDHFLQAAKKVLSVEADVKFVIAGKGDMLDELKELAETLEIRHHVIFAGFLKKKQAEQAFAAANVYVMPSLSEPFGLSSLEALSHDVPVIISKQSGVAEVLQHVLKVDFWDTEDLANKILAILRHPPLAQTLREQGHEEVRQLSWDDSAERIIELYETLVRTKKEELLPATN